MVPANFSKAESIQENSVYQPPTLENIPAGPFPSEQLFKIRK